MVNMLLPGCRFPPKFAAISIWKKSAELLAGAYLGRTDIKQGGQR